MHHDYKWVHLTDIHLQNKKYPGYLEYQVKCLSRVLEEEKPVGLLITGDIFERRSPDPLELLAFQDFLEYAHDIVDEIILLRGNHDSRTKSDDGITSLSLFKPYAEVITDIQNDGSIWWIPHYENEQIIKDVLANIPENDTLFGHFGYNGCIDTAGNSHFTITLDDLRCRSYLGHIHKHRREKNVVILGDPYQINFGEAFDDKYYGVFSFRGNLDYKIKPMTHGIRHWRFSPSELVENKDLVNNPDFYSILQLNLSKLAQVDVNLLKEKILEEYNIKDLSIHFHPTIDNKKNVSSWKPDRDLVRVNESVWEKFLEKAQTEIPKDQLRQQLEIIQNYETDTA